MNLNFSILLPLLLASSMCIAAVAENSSTSKSNPADSITTSEVEKLAYRGVAEAQYKLGVMYDIGKGVPKDDAKAVEWYEKAAAQGHAEAQYNLGLIYYGGDGVPKDAAKALMWLQKAAAQGNVNAQNFLRLLYEEGKEIP